MHTYVGAQSGLLFDEPPIWSSLSLERPYRHYGLPPI